MLTSRTRHEPAITIHRIHAPTAGRDSLRTTCRGTRLRRLPHKHTPQPVQGRRLRCFGCRCRHRCALVQPHGTLSEGTPQLHLRPSTPCWNVLCAGSGVDVHTSCSDHVHTVARAYARPLRCTGWQIDGSQSSTTRRQPAVLQRTDAHQSTDSEREHSEVRTRGCGRHQQLSTRLPQGGNDIRCHSCRCPVFRRGNVSQGRGGAGGMEHTECGELPTAPA